MESKARQPVTPTRAAKH